MSNPLENDILETDALKECLRAPLFYILSITLIVWGYFVSPWPMAYTAIFAIIIATLTTIDLRHMILPDIITLPGILIAILAFQVFDISSNALIMHHMFITNQYEAVIGCLSGFALFFSIFYISFKIKGEPGMGFGDVKLMAMLGAFLSVTAIPLILVYSSIAALMFITLKSIFKQPLKNTPFAYGPFLCLGAWLTMLYHNETWFFIMNLRANIVNFLIG